MRLLTKYAALPRDRRSLLWRVLPLVFLLRVAVTVLPIRMVLRAVNRYAAPRDSGYGTGMRPDDIAWAVNVVGGRMLRHNPCLPQSLAGLLLFRRSGHPASLHIGVVKEAPGALKAHAWLESEGQVVVGATHEHGRYAPFPHPLA
jgi:hypothetical protein